MTDVLSNLAENLLEHFSEDTRTWAEDLVQYDLRAQMLEVMGDIVQVIGDQTPRLCVGTISFGGERLGAEDDWGTVRWPEVPNTYDAIVVTDKMIVTSWGHIDEASRALVRETLNIKALRQISGLVVRTRPGDERSSGHIATHHDISLTFADGEMAGLPDCEDELSEIGIQKMAELIPALYENMSG